MHRTSWVQSFIAHLPVNLDENLRVLSDMLAPHRKGNMVKTQSRASAEAPPSNGDDDSSPMIVLPSSTDLFLFYGQSLEQCAKLSTGQALYDLSSLHKKWLRIYAGG